MCSSDLCDHLYARRGGEQRIAVGRGVGDEFEADHAARPRPVVDDDLLAEGFAEFGRKRARQQIGTSADTLRHNQTDRALGKTRRLGRMQIAQYGQCGQCAN